MARRLGIILGTTVLALLVMTDGAWACRCMNRLINRCGHRRVCCCVCVQPVCCQSIALPTCCQPVAGELKATEGAAKIEANVVPSTNVPVLPPAPQPTSPPEVKTPDISAMPQPDIKPESKAEVKPVPQPPILVPVEVPAESRVPAKPDVLPITPIGPVKPLAPKPADAPKPEAPKPDTAKAEATKPEPPKPETPKPEAPKPAEAPKPEPPKPDTPKTEKPKEDPFGANDTTQGLRLWTDASGKYRIEARFVSFQDGTVRLQRANGRYVRIAYELLCSVDQKFVIDQDESLLAME